MSNEIENTETKEPVATEPETMLDKLSMQNKSSWSDIPKHIFLQGMINFLKKSIENIKTLEKESIPMQLELILKLNKLLEEIRINKKEHLLDSLSGLDNPLLDALMYNIVRLHVSSLVSEDDDRVSLWCEIFSSLLYIHQIIRRSEANHE